MTSPDQEPLQPESSSHESPAQEAIGLAKWQKLLTVTATLLTLLAVCFITIRMGMAIHHTILLFSLGALVAYALQPLVDLVRRPRFGKSQRQLGKTPSVFVVFAVLGLVSAGGIWWLGAQAGHQVKVLQQDAPQYRTRAIELAHNFDENVLKTRGIDFSLEQNIEQPPAEVTAYAERLSKEALPFVAHTIKDFAEAGVVLLIALYLLIFATDMKEQANNALSPFLRKYALPWEEDVNRILGGFVRGQLVVALITGACAAVGLLILGEHLWLIIGMFVVLASLIPVFGPYIAAVPAVLAALIGPTRLSPIGGAIMVVILFVVINEAASKILYPKLVGKALNLHEVLVLFVLFAGLEVDGIIGTLFAAPIASLALVTLVHLYRLWQELPEESIADEIQRGDGTSRMRAFKR